MTQRSGGVMTDINTGRGGISNGNINLNKQPPRGGLLMAMSLSPGLNVYFWRILKQRSLWRSIIAYTNIIHRLSAATTPPIFYLGNNVMYVTHHRLAYRAPSSRNTQRQQQHP